MSESSVSSQATDCSVIPITYTLKGHFKIETPVLLKDLSEVNRRASIIMACNLLFDDRLKQLKKFRPFIASNIYKIMCKFMPQPTEMYKDRIPNWKLTINLKSYICNDFISENKIPEDDNLNSEINDNTVYDKKVAGCQELVVANEFIVVISYKLSLKIKLNRMEIGEAELFKDGYKISPEPHSSWSELIKDVDKAHSENGIESSSRGFSATLSDNAISLDIRCRPITYVVLEEN